MQKGKKQFQISQEEQQFQQDFLAFYKGYNRGVKNILDIPLNKNVLCSWCATQYNEQGKLTLTQHEAEQRDKRIAQDSKFICNLINLIIGENNGKLTNLENKQGNYASDQRNMLALANRVLDDLKYDVTLNMKNFALLQAFLEENGQQQKNQQQQQVQQGDLIRESKLFSYVGNLHELDTYPKVLSVMLLDIGAAQKHSIKGMEEYLKIPCFVTQGANVPQNIWSLRPNDNTQDKEDEEDRIKKEMKDKYFNISEAIIVRTDKKDGSECYLLAQVRNKNECFKLAENPFKTDGIIKQGQLEKILNDVHHFDIDNAIEDSKDKNKQQKQQFNQNQKRQFGQQQQTNIEFGNVGNQNDDKQQIFQFQTIDQSNQQYKQENNKQNPKVTFDGRKDEKTETCQCTIF